MKLNLIMPAVLGVCLFPLQPNLVCAQAMWTPATSTEIDLAGQEVFNIRTNEGGFSPQQRAETVRERLIPILGIKNIHPDDVAVIQTVPDKYASIFVRHQLLIRVDDGLARANKTSSLSLANAWAAKLRQVLPQASVKQNH